MQGYFISSSLMMNYDDTTHFTDNPGTKNIFIKDDQYILKRVINSTKTNTSLMYASTADG